MKMKFVAALLLAISLVSPGLSPSSLPTDRLDSWYAGYNTEYFQDELPKYVIITHNLIDDRFRAVTELSGDYYHIDFNPNFNPAPKYADAGVIELLTLLHEMCHVQMMVENDMQLDQHGSHWQGCMHRLADARAFDQIW